MLIDHLSIFFGELSIQVFCLFLNYIIFVVELQEFLTYSAYWSLIKYMIFTCFLPFCGLPFQSVDCFLCTVYKYDVDLSIFALVACTFGVISKISLLRTMLRGFFPMFSSRSYTVSSFTFKPLIHLELIFMSNRR